MKKYKYTEHPCVVVLADVPHLRIFEDPFIEETLPKWKKAIVKPEKKEDGKPEITLEYIATNANNINIVSNGPASAPETNTNREGAPTNLHEIDMSDAAKARRAQHEEAARQRMINNAKWDRDRYLRNRREFINAHKGKYGKFLLWLKDLNPFGSKPDEVETTFEQVKEAIVPASSDELKKSFAIANAYCDRLQSVGQMAKAEQLQSVKDTIAYQLTLAQHGFNKYLTEADALKFLLRANRGVNIEFLRYFGGVIPKDVVDKKLEADKLCIFDNYVVMHYDSANDIFRRNAVEDIEQERQRRRDPILFGMIYGCRKLFYIADWTTPEDDLTYEVVEKIVGGNLYPTEYETKVIGDEEVQDAMDKMMHDLDSIMNSSTPLTLN